MSEGSGHGGLTLPEVGTKHRRGSRLTSVRPARRWTVARVPAPYSAAMDLRAALAASPPPADGRVVLAIPDGTRPVAVARALDALRDHLPPDTVALVGLGLHRRMRADELPASPFPVFQHDPDDVVPTSVVDGIPGQVSRQVAAADTVLGLGVVELHQYAGYSGGHKAVAVGCGGRATLDALHHRDRVIAPGVEIGRLAGNPFRAAVDALGEAARCRWTLLQTGPDAWVAGEPRRALERGAGALDCWEDVGTRYAAAILRVKGRKGVNLYQASRAATYLALSPDPPLLPGATLYLEAECPEGLGEGDGERAFARVLASLPPPWAGLLDGPAPTGAGTQRAVMLALLLRRYPRLVICGVRDAAPLRAVGLDATEAPADALRTGPALDVPDPFGRLPRFRP